MTSESLREEAGRHRVWSLRSTFRASPLERLNALTEVDPETGCHNFTGTRLHNGYGCWRIKRGGCNRAHRNAWTLMRGPIPDGLHVDHLCRNRRCVNVEHMELVTPEENTRRGNSPSAISARTGMCQRGHVMDEANTLIHGSKKGRSCRICYREYRRNYQRRQRAPHLAPGVQP